jgi:hypothetical protein
MPSPLWLVTCSCGWGRECVSQWAAESVAKLHPKLGAPDAVHTVRVDAPSDQELGQPDLPLT